MQHVFGAGFEARKAAMHYKVPTVACRIKATGDRSRNHG